jgi:hypothetical protein
MKPSLDMDEIKGRKVKTQDGPLLMTPRGTMSRPLTFEDVEPSSSKESFSLAEEKDPSFSTDRVNTGDIINARNALSEISSSSSYASPSSSSSLRDLYGGAITITLPDSFKDVSDLRPVPDHQEVYLDQHTSASFIIEILNYEDSITNDMAASYYFDDLAQSNQVIGCSLFYEFKSNSRFLGKSCNYSELCGAS